MVEASSSDSGSTTDGELPASMALTRFTRIRTCPAFHGVQAAGPAAWASASVSAANRSRSATLPTWRGDRLDRRRVVGVATQRGLRQQQVMPHQPDHHRGVDSGKPQVRQPFRCQLGSGDAVVQTGALADVVHQRGDQQQVGTVDRADQPGGLDRGLHQMPVHGVSVHRVALRQRPEPVPGGQDRGDHPGLVEGLPDACQRFPRAEQFDQRPPGVVGPRHRHRRGVLDHPQQRGRCDRDAGQRRGCPEPERHRRVARRVDRAGQHGLAVLLDHAVGQRAALHPRPGSSDHHGRR